MIFIRFRQAINYVTKTTHQDPIEPHKLAEMFRLMDTDGSGTVDYNEFVVAMTTDLSEGLKGTKGTQVICSYIHLNLNCFIESNLFVNSF